MNMYAFCMHKRFHGSIHETYVCTVVKMVDYTVTAEGAVGMASATVSNSVVD